ncbi:nicotinate phosphoribosyltransferase [Nanoarchaeota archaeon]
MNSMQQFADKYFLRTNQILKGEGLNPWVNMQVFVRNGPGKVAGVDEAIDLITANSDIESVGGRIYAKSDGQQYTPKETQMNIIAPIQSIVELETVYLGVISAGITLENSGSEPDLASITRNVAQVVDLTGGRPVFYFGARHWHYNADADISAAAFRGGVAGCSTDAGAAAQGQLGMGTIPHVLETIMAHKYGRGNAVAMATLAFDRHIDPNVPRIALPDYDNHEISDTIQTAQVLRKGDGQTKKLDGVRIDTCGENIAEGGRAGDRRYWEGPGVTVTGVYALRSSLNQAGERDSQLGLSSGFGDIMKVTAFNEGERVFGVRLYDFVGAGFLDHVRTATADVVAVGDSPDAVDFYTGPVQEENIFHKVGRPPSPNYTLERIL